MGLKRLCNIFLGLFILLVVFNLVSAFLAIDYNPNYKMKGHHDYPFNGYLIFALFAFFWIVSLFGLFQLKYYLLGKDRLQLISFIYAGLISYCLFLILINYPFDSVDSKKQTADLLALIFPSALVLILSRTKQAKRIHNESRQANLKKLREGLGI